jgi:hypothetical protein
MLLQVLLLLHVLLLPERFIEKLLDTDNSTTIQWHNELTEPGGQPETNLLYPAACSLPTSTPCSAVGPSELHLQAPAPCSDLLLLVAAVQKSLITEPIHLETWHRRAVGSSEWHLAGTCSMLQPSSSCSGGPKIVKHQVQAGTRTHHHRQSIIALPLS